MCAFNYSHFANLYVCSIVILVIFVIRLILLLMSHLFLPHSHSTFRQRKENYFLTFSGCLSHESIALGLRKKKLMKEEDLISFVIDSKKCSRACTYTAKPQKNTSNSRPQRKSLSMWWTSDDEGKILIDCHCVARSWKGIYVGIT